MFESRQSHIIKPVLSEHYFDGSWQGGFDGEVGASGTSWEIVVVGTRGEEIESERERSVQNRVQRKNWWSFMPGFIYRGGDGEAGNKGLLNLGEWKISSRLTNTKVGNGWSC